MDNLRNRNVEHLGVNQIGKNIRKSPLHQPNFAASNGVGNNVSIHSENSAASVGAQRPHQLQPQVYNVSKNEFRNIVQQLTGSPARDPLPRPVSTPHKPPSMRLQRIRPPPLAPLKRPPPPQMYTPAPPLQQVHMQWQHQASGPGPGHYFVRPGQFGQLSPVPTLPVTPVATVWANTTESPISAYMRYLQNSIVDGPIPHTQQRNHPQQPPHPSQQNQQPQPPSFHPPNQPQRPAHPHQQMQQHFNGQLQPRQNPSPGLLPNPPGQPFPSPRMNGPPPLLPSPTSQYLLPSPNGYMNFPTPWYPILSPNGQFPPPLTPTFPFSPIGQFGILGMGPKFPPPPSPGMAFPISPSGFFPIISPRWKEQ